MWPRWVTGADLAAIARPSGWLLVGLLVSALYLFGASLAPSQFSQEPPEPLYPPQAVVLAVLLLTRPRHWWLLLLQAYCIQVTIYLGMGYTVVPTLLGHSANVVEALLGALLVRRFVASSRWFDTLRLFAGYAVCVVAAAMVGATLGAASLLPTGRPYWPTWQAWFLGDVLASLLLAPTILLWAGVDVRRCWQVSRQRAAEAVLLGISLLVVGFLAYGSRPFSPDVAPGLLFAPAPLLLWAAVRFGPRGIAAALCPVTAFAVAAVVNGYGPFSLPSPEGNLVRLQAFLSVIGVPLFLLAALVRERGQALAQLAESEARYRAVVSNFPRGVVLLFGSDLRHVFADGNGLPNVGLTSEDIEGKTPSEAFPASMADALAPSYTAALNGGEAAFDLAHAGHTYQVQVLPVPYGDTPTGMVVMQDVTEQRGVEQLAALNQAKTTFFNNVSHEFRTPLTLLLAPIEELLASADSLAPASRELLTNAQANGLRLRKLVNTLLDFSRLEAGHVRAAFEPVDLAALTADLVSAFRSAFEQAGVRLVVACPPLGEPVYVDRDHWEQIILNLLSNARKFTRAGEVTVSLRLDGTGVALEVRDTGVGIPAHELPRLFERFHQVESPQKRLHEGTGIGLTIVQGLVRLHGGTVAVQSVLGQGSAFTITVPRGTAHLPADQIVRPADRAAVRARPTELAHVATYLDGSRFERPLIEPASDDALPAIGGGESDRPARLLVVDDHPDMRVYLTHLLSECGAVEAVPDATTALELARTWQPDLILTDVIMPGLDGFDFLRAVRADPRLQSASVILLSARSGDDARAQGLRAGADDYLVKPFTSVELVARVDSQIRLARLRREVSTAAERQRLAHDLHDAVTQSLYSLTLLAEASRHAVTEGQRDQADEYLKQLGETARQALREMRLIVRQLRPSVLAERGLTEALSERLDAVERRSGIGVQLLVTGEIELPAAAEETFYYIAQEALNNALKHASATQVTVRIAARRGITELSVVDNGCGFDLAQVAGRGGLGLVSMRERAERMGASVVIECGGRHGTQVTVRLRDRQQEERLVPGSVRPFGADTARHAKRSWPTRSAS